jgi:hypothetical protein
LTDLGQSMKQQEFSAFWEQMKQEFPDFVDQFGIATIIFENGSKFRVQEHRKIERIGLLERMVTSSSLEVSYFLPEMGLIREYLDGSPYRIGVFESNCLRPAGFDFSTEWIRQERVGYTITKIIDNPRAVHELLGIFNLAILLGEALTSFINHFSKEEDLFFEIKTEATFTPFNESITWLSQYWLDNRNQ